MELLKFIDATDLFVLDVSPGNRTLATKICRKKGEILFHEDAVLSSWMGRDEQVKDWKMRVKPSENVPVSWDIQRLLDVWVCHMGREEYKEKMKALNCLSTDGVESELSKEADPFKIPDFQEAAKAWVDRLRTKRKKDKKKVSEAVYQPTQAEILKLLYYIDTNSHSRTLKEGEVGDEEDELIGLYLAASLPNHSCLPNATAILADSTSENPLRLALKLIKDVKEGESITISYIDREMADREERRALLAKRGFECQCELCSGKDGWRDYARVAACLECTEGLLAPCHKDDSWICDSCHIFASKERIAEIVKCERPFRQEQPEADSTEENVEEMIKAVIKFVKDNLKELESAISSGKLEKFLDGLTKFSNQEAFCIHPMHFIFYNVLHDNLFENPDYAEIFGHGQELNLLLWMTLSFARLSQQMRNGDKQPVFWYPLEESLHCFEWLLKYSDSNPVIHGWASKMFEEHCKYLRE